jgi:hypothetical protein
VSSPSGERPVWWFVMTETHTLDEMISEALAVIDKGLGDLLHRELVSSNEVADLLLDVRTLLANPGSASSDDRDDLDVPVPG